LDEQGKIGEVVVDVGAGEISVSDIFDGKKVVQLDIGLPKDSIEEDLARIVFDLDKVGVEVEAVRDMLGKVADFLGIERCEEEANCEVVDTFIFSEILNYVDFRKVMEFCAKFLKKGGRFIIFNKAGIGYYELFHDNGVKENKDLKEFVIEQGFECEYEGYITYGITVKGEEIPVEPVFFIFRKFKPYKAIEHKIIFLEREGWKVIYM